MKEKKSKASSTKTDKNILKEILKISEEIHNIADIDILLDKILLEVRHFTNAEGGSIFMVEDDKLRMSYTQNDLIFSNNPATRYKYQNQEIPLDIRSIAGATVKQGKILEFKDVYKISEKCGCYFNGDFDRASGYRTKSMISVPLKSVRNRVIGVMQIINAKGDNGKVVPFNDQDELFISYFANDAATAIEKAKSTRAMVLRMLKMVEFRDPKETGGHVNRMGAYSVEIYQQWAQKRGFPDELIRRFKDKLRIASMLHDVGKVAISDQILKKPGKLEPHEFDTMKMHTIFGYRLFSQKESELDAMAAEIALTHHEKWDGTGYPGAMADYSIGDSVNAGNEIKKESIIPITGRIAAVADVYDALISKRVYKDAWQEDRVLEYMKQSAGTHFDPEVVDAFFDIYDVIKAIRHQYAENGAD
ncbi:MAG: HD domain-containing phosphohydrolase [Candidatus Goldiibacteriota bacterium]|jgi:HD-GYP domain-containing protein (c-di-GMP phosphodiesterase class II)